jgi:hypothetical protein
VATGGGLTAFNILFKNKNDQFRPRRPEQRSGKPNG